MPEGGGNKRRKEPRKTGKCILCINIIEGNIYIYNIIINIYLYIQGRFSDQETSLKWPEFKCVFQ